MAAPVLPGFDLLCHSCDLERAEREEPSLRQKTLREKSTKMGQDPGHRRHQSQLWLTGHTEKHQQLQVVHSYR